MSGSNVREQPIAPGKSVHDDQLPLHEGHRRPDQERACAGGQHLKPNLRSHGDSAARLISGHRVRGGPPFRSVDGCPASRNVEILSE
jgi:hypothetical protein